MIIDEVLINPGENKLIKLNVSKLPSGNNIDIQANVYRSKVKGPTILLVGGVHGDEINGIEIVRRMVSSPILQKLVKGNVIAIPLLNIYGFLNFSREVPDGKDINRSFPGSSTGSLASRVAYKISKQILPLIDVAIDFHTGGKSLSNIPQLRITDGEPRDLELAKIFGTDFIVYSKVIQKSLRKEMKKRGKPILVFEGGESLRIDEYAIQEGIKGVKNILSHYGMIKENIQLNEGTKLIKEGYWERAKVSGIFTTLVKPGDLVQKQAVIGKISPVFGGKTKPIKAKKQGYIYGINNNPVVNQGDALFHIGQ